jgi:hypothetical protein
MSAYPPPPPPPSPGNLLSSPHFIRLPSSFALLFPLSTIPGIVAFHSRACPFRSRPGVDICHHASVFPTG